MRAFPRVVLGLLALSFFLPPTLACGSEIRMLRHGCLDHKMAWACAELGDRDAETNSHFNFLEPIACYRPRYSGGLPPIVVPPVIASFDPFAVSLRLNTMNVLGVGGGFCEAGISRNYEARFGFLVAFVKKVPNVARRLATIERGINPERAHKLVEYSCRRDFAADCVDAGNHRRYSGDRVGARSFFIEGCAKGDADSCIAQAQWEIESGDRAEQAKYWLAACNRGSRFACRYYYGQFAPPNIFQFASFKYRQRMPRSASR